MGAKRYLQEYTGTKFQRFVLGATAALVALRAFFPAQYFLQRGDPRTDAAATLLHILGILTVSAALLYFAPSPTPTQIWTVLAAALVVLRLLVPAQLIPRIGDAWYVVDWEDRARLTLGIWKRPIGSSWVTSPDWELTAWHVLGIVGVWLVGLLWFDRKAP